VKTRQPLAILAATAVAGLGLTALATPASANSTVTVGGTWLPQSEQDVTVNSPANPISGSTFSLVNNSDYDIFLQVQSLPSPISVNGFTCLNGGNDKCSVPKGGVPVTVTIAEDADNDAIDIYGETGLGSNSSVTSAFAVSSSSQPDPDPTPEPDPSPDVSNTTGSVSPGTRIQQFPRPTSGTCDANQPEGLNWSGVASGGWGESWAQWMHEGQGGAVCTRTLAYNNSTATWQVQ